MKKYLFFLIFSFILVLSVNLYFRVFPAYFPQLLQFAKLNVEHKIYETARAQVETTYPSLAPFAKDQASRYLASQIKNRDKTRIRSEVKKEYLKLKDPFQDESGQTYLMELDCWHWARYVSNVNTHGYPGDLIKQGVQWDTYMLAPYGSPLVANRFLFYFSSILYKICSFFFPIPLNVFLFYLPLLFVVLLITTIFLFCAMYFGPVAAILSSLFIGLAPIFIPRSCVGWFDMDVLNLLFPFLITWLYLASYNPISWRARLLYVCVAACMVGFFSFVWPHWWFIVVILVGYECLTLLHLLLSFFQYGRREWSLFKSHVLTLFCFLIASLVCIFAFSGKSPLIDLFTQLRDAPILNRSFSTSLWPNVYFTVQELGKANLNQIVGLIGDRLLFLFSLVSMLVLFIVTRLRKDDYFLRQFIFVMVLWFFSMFLASYKGIRFIMFMTIPLGISFGWCIQYGLEYFADKLRKGIVLLISFVLLFSIVDRAFATARHIFPLINDNWYNLLLSIKDKTPRQAILNSWWDFGDWFKAIAQRRVIFDGQSQNTPQAYWMAKILLENDEERAVAMLRMLNKSANRAFELIDSRLHSPLESIMLLEKVLSERSDAQAALSKVLPADTVKEVMDLVFGKPDAPIYFIVDPTMPDKIYAISFMGNWDFTKSYILNRQGKKGSKRTVGDLIAMGVDRNKAQQYYQEITVIPRQYLDDWISNRVRFYGSLVTGIEKDGIVLFENSIVYNPAKKTVYLFYNNGYRIPQSLFIVEKGELQEIVFEKSELGFSVLIMKTEEGYSAIGLDRQLGKSMFVRLFFLNGKGLTHFKPFLEQKEAGGYIRVFKVE